MSTDDLITDFTFPHNYKCELSIEKMKAGLLYYYPGASLIQGKDGVMIEVSKKDCIFWRGVFSSGSIVSKEAISGVFSLPNPDYICVVSKGSGYFVCAKNPTDWSEIDCFPITNVRVSQNSNIIIFATLTELWAYDGSGLKWKTERLSWDNLKISKITNTSIYGEFWDIRKDDWEYFMVDLLTGTHQGGLGSLE